jgi:hypothetical protein
MIGMRREQFLRRACRGRSLLRGFLFVSLALPSSTVHAAEDDRWELNLAPYYWAPSLDVDLGFGTGEYVLNEEFLNQPWTFKPNVAGAWFTAEKRNWLFVMEGETLDSDTDVTLPDGSPGELEYQNQRVSMGAGYRFVFPVSENSRLHLEPWLGARYRHASQRLVQQTNVVDSLEDGWLEPLAGLRAQWCVGEKFSASLTADIDGFLNNRPTWLGAGLLKWHWTHEFSLTLGYQYTAFDFDEGEGDERWTASGDGHGVLLGLELDFLGESVPNRVWDGRLTAGTDGDRTDPPSEETREADGWLDRLHDYLNDRFDAGAGYADRLLSGKREDIVARRKSRFGIGFNSRLSEVSSVDFEIKPEVEMDLHVPNLERELKLIVSSKPVDELPGTDPLDREQGLSFGVETTGLFLKKTKFRAGVRSPFDPYAAFAWMPKWETQRWHIGPTISAYYRSDQGFGSYASVHFRYLIRDRFRCSYVPSIDYNELRHDWQWIQNLAFVYLFEGDEEDYHRGIMVLFTADGTETEGTERVRWMPVYYRAPLYGKWLYFEVGPEIMWESRTRWEPEPSLRFGMNALFWGTKER